MSEDGCKAIPYKMNDFKKIRDEGGYYVDKTELISDLLSEGSMLEMILRPKGFGKSVNLSMLDAFFNMKYKGNTWFDGLKVSEHEETAKHKNAYPVIYLDLSSIEADSYESFLVEMGAVISELFRGFNLDYSDSLKEGSNIKESSKIAATMMMDRYNRGIEQKLNKAELGRSLLFFCQMIREYYGVRPVVLIDNYDHPLNIIRNDDEYEQILSFLMHFYECSMKGNSDLEFAVLTGTMFIVENSICSGWNNFFENTIFSNEYDERFGFTETEVREICDHYGHPEKFEEAEKWYGGYRFGNAKLSNPWSIIKYVRWDFEPDVYWKDDNANDVIDYLLDNSNEYVYSELKKLAEGQSVGTSIELQTSMHHLISDSSYPFYSALVMTGYFSAVKLDIYEYELSFPNLEAKGAFSSRMFDYNYADDATDFRWFFDGMEEADVEKMKETLDWILKHDAPFFLLSKKEEYPMILASASISRFGRYAISIEESDDKREVVVMRPLLPDVPSIIFELRKTDVFKPKQIKKAADETLCQIKEKQYFREMTGRVLLYGICIYGRNTAIAAEEISL